jgi:hypothetical protein
MVCEKLAMGLIEPSFLPGSLTLRIEATWLFDILRF